MNQNQIINKIQKQNYLNQLKENLEAGILKGQIGMTIVFVIQDVLECE